MLCRYFFVWRMPIKNHLPRRYERSLDASTYISFATNLKSLTGVAYALTSASLPECNLNSFNKGKQWMALNPIDY